MPWGEQGRRLRQMRDARGLTGWDVAVSIGCKPQSISNWETGKYRPGLEMARALGLVYDATEDILAMYGYSADQSMAERLAAVERRLDEQAATIARLVEIVGLTLDTASQAAKPRRRPKS